MIPPVQTQAYQPPLGPCDAPPPCESQPQKEAAAALQAMDLDGELSLPVTVCYNAESVQCTEDRIKYFKHISTTLGKNLSLAWIELLVLVQNKRSYDGVLRSIHKRLTLLNKDHHACKCKKKKNSKGMGKPIDVWGVVAKDPYALPDLYMTDGKIKLTETSISLPVSDAELLKEIDTIQGLDYERFKNSGDSWSTWRASNPATDKVLSVI
jgi:hypothetical protein